jgi:hypothetical protein
VPVRDVFWIANDSITSEYASWQNFNCIFKDGEAALAWTWEMIKSWSKSSYFLLRLYTLYLPHRGFSIMWPSSTTTWCSTRGHETLEPRKISPYKLSLICSIPLYVQKCRQTRDRFYCIPRLGCYKNIHSVTFTLVKTSIQFFGVRGGVVGIVTPCRLDGPGFEGQWGRNFPNQSRPASRPNWSPLE